MTVVPYSPTCPAPRSFIEVPRRAQTVFSSITSLIAIKTTSNPLYLATYPEGRTWEAALLTKAMPEGGFDELQWEGYSRQPVVFTQDRSQSSQVFRSEHAIAFGPFVQLPAPRILGIIDADDGSLWFYGHCRPSVQMDDVPTDQIVFPAQDVKLGFHRRDGIG